MTSGKVEKVGNIPQQQFFDIRRQHFCNTWEVKYIPTPMCYEHLIVYKICCADLNCEEISQNVQQKKTTAD